jgi:putative endonuclease
MQKSAMRIQNHAGNAVRGVRVGFCSRADGLERFSGIATVAGMRPKRKRAFVYVVKCADGTLYTGTAADVEKRIAVHNSGKGAKYTRPRLPVVVVLQEGPMLLTKALRREYQIKQLTRPQKQALIAGELVLKHRR